MAKAMSEMTDVELVWWRNTSQHISEDWWRTKWTRAMSLILANQYDAEITRRKREKETSK